MYMAGYGVECAMKAVLLASAPGSQHARILKSFYGKIGHDFEWLKKEMTRRGVTIDADAGRHLRRVNTWTTELRYVPGRQDIRETKAFIDAATQLIRWSQGRL